MWMMYPSLKTPSGYDTTYNQNYGQFVSLVNGNKLNSNTNRYLEIDKFNSPLIDLLSVDHIIATRKTKEGLSIGGSFPESISNNHKYILVKDFGQFAIFKNSTSLPFIRPIKNILINQDQSQTQDLLTRNDIKDLAIIDHQIPNSEKIDSQVEIKNINISSQKISFDTISQNKKVPYFLIISQNFDSNWKTKIDDSASQIIKTNHTLTGLFVQPGNHHIVLSYQPDIFFFSLKLSVLSLSISVLFILIYLLWKKNHR
jgi:hypothetical protein